MVKMARKIRPRGKDTPEKLSAPEQSGGSDDDSQADPLADLRAAIWQIVASIPEGKVATYGQIARLAGYPSHARYVGRTLRQLPEGSRLPWHRVLNASRQISRRERGSDTTQRKRLGEEGVVFIGNRAAKGHLWEP